MRLFLLSLSVPDKCQPHSDGRNDDDNGGGGGGSGSGNRGLAPWIDNTSLATRYPLA